MQTRDLITELDEQFALLHRNACDLVKSVSFETLEGRPSGSEQLRPALSLRETILRSAAVVEQTFGGITANLWDDPFEWTLPETLDSAQRIIEYLEEVEATRRRAFAGMTDDTELSREIVVPSGEKQTLISLLRETLSRASSSHDRALEMRALIAASGS